MKCPFTMGTLGSPFPGGSNDGTTPLKKRKSDVLYQNSYAVTAENRFNALASQNLSEEMEQDEEEAISSPQSSATTSTKKLRIPPISVKGKTRKELIDWCTSHDMKKYRMKMTSTAIDLYCDNVEDFKKSKLLLKEKDFSYHTHALAEEREFRVILKGLFDMSTDEITEELAEMKIKPTTIRKLTPRNPRYQDQVHYVLSFPIGTMKMSLLKQCRYISHLVVTWEFYQP